MSDDSGGRVDQLLAEKQHVVEDSKGLEPHQLKALRALVLEISLMLSSEKQMRWLLIERQFAHVDLDLLDLHEGRTPRSYVETTCETPAQQLRLDILSLLSQVVSLARDF
jgi:hypothetical protein